MKYRCLILILLFSASAYAQRTRVVSAWAFKQTDVRVRGLSLGIFNVADDPHNVRTTGLRLVLIGEGIIVPFMPADPLAADDAELEKMLQGPASEKMNGISIAATGQCGDYRMNGIAIGGIGQFNTRMNGVSFGSINCAQVHNGIQIGAFFSWAYRMRGLQIAVYNRSKQTRGLQVGLWNKNERRSLPFINWNFRRV